MAVLHGEQHLPGRVAVADLADDQPARVEPQGVADELALGDLTDALDVRLARLPLEDGRRPPWVGGEVELAGVLDDDDPRLRRQLVGHRPQQRRLAGAGLTRTRRRASRRPSPPPAASASPGRWCPAARARRGWRRAARCGGSQPAAPGETFMIAASREPSGRRRTSIGLASSNRRSVPPARRARWATSARRSSASANTRSWWRSTRPSTRCNQIVSWALTMMSVTPSRSSRAWNLPAWK